MPRLFVALELPDGTKEKLAQLGGDLPGAAWIPPSQLHLTLRFLGERDEGMFRIIMEALEGMRSPAFHLSLRGIGHFPKRGEPETLWIGTPVNPALVGLRNRIESVLVRRGVEPEKRKFHPHVTLARVRDSRAPWVERYVVMNSLFAIHSIPIHGFALYSSVLTPGGSIHTCERRYALDGILE